jgi:hypothetical protein
MAYLEIQSGNLLWECEALIGYLTAPSNKIVPSKEKKISLRAIFLFLAKQDNNSLIESLNICNVFSE